MFMRMLLTNLHMLSCELCPITQVDLQYDVTQVTLVDGEPCEGRPSLSTGLGLSPLARHISVFIGELSKLVAYLRNLMHMPRS